MELRTESAVAESSSSTPFRKVLSTSIILLTLIPLLVASLPLALAKTKKPAEHKAHLSTPSNLTAELQARLQSLESAKQAGDPTAVFNASRAVIALGLRESGRAETMQGAAAAAIEHYRRSIDFEDLPATRIDLAQAYMSAGRLDECLSQLTNVLVANPDDAHAWYVHGKLWITKRKFDDAVKSLTHAVDLESDPAASYLLGASLLQLKQYDAAKAAFGKLQEGTGNRARLHRALADAYSAAGYRNDSVRELRQAEPNARTTRPKVSGIGLVLADTANLGSSFEPVMPGSQERARMKQLQPKLRMVLASALNDLGTAEARQNKYDVALSYFHEAAGYDADVPGLLRNTGIAAGRAEDYPECIRALRPVLAENPQDNVARSMLGTALFATQSYAEAAETFAPLGDSALLVPEIAYSWAASLVHTNKYAPASELLTKLERQQLSTDTLILLAQLWSQMGDYEHSVEVCHRALKLDPKLLRAHYIAGQALIRLNRSAEAAQELRDELQLDPDNPDVQFLLAFSLLQQSQTAPAVELLKTVLARKPDHAEANYELGKELLLQGEANESISYLEAAVRLKPQFEPAHYQLQSAYRAVGRKEDADREAKVYRALKAKSRNITLPPPRQPVSAAESPH